MLRTAAFHPTSAERLRTETVHLPPATHPALPFSSKAKRRGFVRLVTHASRVPATPERERMQKEKAR